MKHYHLKDAMAAAISTKALLVESINYDGTFFAVDRNKKGMWLIIDDKQIAIDAENVEGFLLEAWNTWQLYKDNSGTEEHKSLTIREEVTNG